MQRHFKRGRIAKSQHGRSAPMLRLVTARNAALLMSSAPFLKYDTAGADIVDRAPNDPSYVYIAALASHRLSPYRARVLLNTSRLDRNWVAFPNAGCVLSRRGGTHTADYIMYGSGPM